MTPDAYYYRLISGRQRGLAASVLRAGLAVPARIYGAVIGIRNACYDLVPGCVRRASVPVISVGNMVTGGTGKTPMVIWIVQRLIDSGLRPAVLMRGYKADRGGCCQANQALQDAIHGCENDEAREIRRRCPRVELVVDPDRVAGAGKAAAMGRDVLVMDDGFQHRRLARDLDIVLIDATNPFGWGMLPRGRRREPISSLARADAIVITRSDQVSADALAELRARIPDIAPGKPILAARHRPVELCDQRGRCDADMTVESLRGRSAWVFAGLGNPGGFVATLEQLGVTVVGQRFWPDHHTWRDDELDAMAVSAGRAEPDLVLTTEKDAVKLPPDRPHWPAPLRVLRVGIDLLDDDRRAMCKLVDRVAARRDPPGDHQE